MDAEFTRASAALLAVIVAETMPPRVCDRIVSRYTRAMEVLPDLDGQELADASAAAADAAILAEREILRDACIGAIQRAVTIGKTGDLTRVLDYMTTVLSNVEASESRRLNDWPDFREGR